MTDTPTPPASSTPPTEPAPSIESPRRAHTILGRLSVAVRQQNWFAVALEVCIVVLGVFIGFQVTNWNESRKERTRETVYLEGIAEDLRGDIAEMDEIVHVAEARMSALGVLLEQADGWRPPASFPSSRMRIEIEAAAPFDPDGPGTIGIELFILSTLDGNRFAYQTLINGDGIGVLRDKALVRQIQGYYARMDKALSFEESLEENRSRLIDEQQQAGISTVDALPADALAARFRGNARLIAAAKNYWLYANRHLFLMRDLRAEADRLATLLERQGSP